MRYYRRLYWGEDLKKKKEKIIRRLNTGKLQRDIYVLVLPEHGSNQLEIYNAALFLQPDFPNDDFFVVGIVRGYEAALEKRLPGTCMNKQERRISAHIC